MRILIACLVLVSACSFGQLTVQAQVINPAPVPEGYLPAPALPEPDPVEIPLPFSVPLSTFYENGLPFKEIAEREACKFVSGAENVPVVGDVRYEAWRGPLQELVPTGNTIPASVLIYYWGDAGLAQCGWDDEPAREAVIGFDARVSWAPKWSLRARVDFRPIKPRNRCRLTHWNVDVTDRLVGIGERQLAKAGNKINSLMGSKYTAAGIAGAWWRELQAPKPYGQAWLLLQPRTVMAGPINFTDTEVSSTFTVTATPKLVPGPRPTSPLIPLPDLIVPQDLAGVQPQFLRVRETVAAKTLAPSVFNISTDLSVGFDEINQRLNNPELGLVGSTYAVGRRELKITGVRLYAARDKIAIELQVEGRAIKGNRPKVVDVVTAFVNLYRRVQYRFEKNRYKLSGKIYLTARPQLNAVDKSVVLSGVEFDHLTAQLLNKKAKWVLQTSVAEAVRGKFAVSYGSPLDRLRTEINAALNQNLTNAATLSGTVDSLEIERMFIDARGVSARVRARGSIALRVNWR